MRRAFGIGILVLALGSASPSSAAEFTEEEIKRLVLEAILENPEIVLEAVEILREREAEAASRAKEEVLSNQRNLLENDPNAPEIGNPDGDVTVVEFFDYNCPFCKRASAEVAQLLEKDANVRVVYREWPILSEGSVVAARASLAARNQGKYQEFHEALMGLKGRADEASVMRVAKDVGLDLDRLREDMAAPEIDEHLQTTSALAQQLGFNGTPSFVVGDGLAPGFIELNELEAMVAEARAAE